MKTKKHRNRIVFVSIVVSALVNLICFTWYYVNYNKRWYPPVDEGISIGELILEFFYFPETSVIYPESTPIPDIIVDSYKEFSGIALLQSLYLFDRFNQPDAAHTIYESLEEWFTNYGDSIPPKTFETIVYPYLERGARKGSEKCILTLNDLFQKDQYVKKDLNQKNKYQFLHDSITAKCQTDTEHNNILRDSLATLKAREIVRQVLESIEKEERPDSL